LNEKVGDNMAWIVRDDLSWRKVNVTVRRKHLDEAEALGFTSLDAYIEYLQLMVKVLSEGNKNAMQKLAENEIKIEQNTNKNIEQNTNKNEVVK